MLSPRLRHARARVHGRDQGEVCREGEGAGGAGQRHRVILQRLAQPLQLGGPELRHLVEEEHPAVGQADLAGARPRPAADEPDISGRLSPLATRLTLDACTPSKAGQSARVLTTPSSFSFIHRCPCG